MSKKVKCVFDNNKPPYTTKIIIENVTREDIKNNDLQFQILYSNELWKNIHIPYILVNKDILKYYIKNNYINVRYCENLIKISTKYVSFKINIVLNKCLDVKIISQKTTNNSNNNNLPAIVNSIGLNDCTKYNCDKIKKIRKYKNYSVIFFKKRA